MKLLDLFSGIGGFSLAARWAGIDTVAFCEINPFCQKVLRKNFPGVQIYSDIKELRNDGSIRAVDIISGGFPCQPFSVAGKRRGTADDRDLWPEMLRIIKEFRPTWILGENVAGFVNMELDRTLSDLEREGYSCRAFIIPACGVGAPHRRDRVWIVANSRRELFKRPVIGGADEVETGNGDADFAERSVETFGTVANPFQSGLEGSERPRPLQGGGEIAHGATAERCRDSQWQENWLEVATRLCGVDARIPSRVDRLRSLGNSIVPQVAFKLFEAIVEANR